MEQYVKAFNFGYLISKYKPRLSKALADSLSPSNSYLEGLINGREQHEFELIQEQLKEFQNLRTNSYLQKNELGRE